MNQTEEDFLIYDDDDEAIAAWFKNNKTKAQLIPFSLTKTFEKGAFIKNKKMEVNIINEEEFTMETETMALEGQHNMKNAMAATSVAKLMKIRNATIRESLSNFQGVEHRLEKVLKIQNVQYINDSKATNPHAASAALLSHLSNIWIAGGLAKGAKMDELISRSKSRIKAAILIGKDAEIIAKALEKFAPEIPVHKILDNSNPADLMDEVVECALKLSSAGDTVLLAPACASMDQFSSYAQRGDLFIDSVTRLVTK